jgi:protein TonB
MSYLRAYSNTYPNQLYANRLQNNRQRSTGIIFAVLVHIGLVIAIGSGLTVNTIFHEPPQLTVRAIDPPIIIPPAPRPIDGGHLTKTFTMPEPLRPTVVTDSTDPNAGDDPTYKPQPTTEVGNGGTGIIDAKVDPHHPLTQPGYPATSRRLGEEGTVELSLYILADGRVGEVRIEQSSGFARLDEAAQQHALKSWRLLPGQIDGIASAGWQRIAITFRLKK